MAVVVGVVVEVVVAVVAGGEGVGVRPGVGPGGSWQKNPLVRRTHVPAGICVQGLLLTPIVLQVERFVLAAGRHIRFQFCPNPQVAQVEHAVSEVPEQPLLVYLPSPQVAQSAHLLLEVDEQTLVWYVPAPQVVQALQNLLAPSGVLVVGEQAWVSYLPVPQVVQTRHAVSTDREHPPLLHRQSRPAGGAGGARCVGCALVLAGPAFGTGAARPWAGADAVLVVLADNV